MTLKKYLHTLSGDDYAVINRCEKRLQNRFALIGAFVLFIFFLCLASSYLTFIKLFPSFIVGIPVALFFAWMITNLYLLLLYTLSKNVLPHEKGRKTRIFSIGGRALFICFIAVFVSKPLEVLVFSEPLAAEIARFKQEKTTKYNELTTAFFDGEIKQINHAVETEKNLGGDFNSARIEKYRRLSGEKRQQKEKLIGEMNRRVENSNFYIQSIAVLNAKYPACWLLTLLVVSIFLTPAVLKNFVSEKSNYYDLKRRIEVGLIRQEYFSFKTQYSRIFQNRFGAEKTFSELYADAPFNTILKIDRTKFFAESDLIAELYDA